MIAQRYAVGPDNVNRDPYMDYVCNGKPWTPLKD
jgi:hypothetical protein